jgi:hypothetical protein
MMSWVITGIVRGRPGPRRWIYVHFCALGQLSLAPSNGAPAIATYSAGPLRKVTWTRTGDAITMTYELRYEQSVDVLGIRFDFPEADVTSKRWVGKGPYRVWQNRREGGVFGFHETAYNNPIPGETYVYPEFKKYFDEWRWLTLATTNARVTVENVSAVPFFGLIRPQGGVNPMLNLPDAFLIPSASDGQLVQQQPGQLSGRHA